MNLDEQLKQWEERMREREQDEGLKREQQAEQQLTRAMDRELAQRKRIYFGEQ